MSARVPRRSTESHVRELLVQEYVSLRAESLAAKQNQQTILQWTLATVGIVVAASVAAVAALKDLNAASQLAINAATAIMAGLCIPVIVALAFGIWLGELNRMQRAGQFLRSREAAWSRGLAAESDPDDPHSGHLLLWETLIAGQHRDYPKNRLGGKASVLLFATLYAFSLVAGVLIVVASGGVADQLAAHFSTPAAAIGLRVAAFTAAASLSLAVIVVYWKPVRYLDRETSPVPTLAP